jgi:hypothetical protein
MPFASLVCSNNPGFDTLIRHPIYAEHGWVSIVNPGPKTADRARRLLADAYDLARTRHQRRQS